MWAQVDKEVTDQAPWVSMFNPKYIDFLLDSRSRATSSARSGTSLIDQSSVEVEARQGRRVARVRLRARNRDSSVSPPARRAWESQVRARGSSPGAGSCATGSRLASLGAVHPDRRRSASLAPVYAHHIAHTDPFVSNISGTTVVNGKSVQVIQQGGGKLGLGETPIGPTWQRELLPGRRQLRAAT